jgi:hypothetical protein
VLKRSADIEWLRSNFGQYLPPLGAERTLFGTCPVTVPADRARTTIVADGLGWVRKRSGVTGRVTGRVAGGVTGSGVRVASRPAGRTLAVPLLSCRLYPDWSEPQVGHPVKV